MEEWKPCKTPLPLGVNSQVEKYESFKSTIYRKTIGGLL